MSGNITTRHSRALVSNDPDQIIAAFTEDDEWLSPPGNTFALALEAPHHMVGRAAIVRFFTEDFPRLFARDLNVAVGGSHAEGERGTMEATVTATLAGGNRYVNDYCFVVELQDGLIHRVREYVDTARGRRMIFGKAPASRPALHR